MTRTLAAGIVPALLGLVTIWLATDLGFGTLANPGPGLWPAIVAAVLVIAGVVIAVQARDDTEGFTRDVITVVIAAASLGVYTFLLELTGFEIPTVVLLVLWLKVFGRERWRTTVIVSVVATAAAYGVFVMGLRVPLPHLIVL